MSPHYLQLPYNPAETYVSNQKLASIMDDLNMSEYISAYILAGQVFKHNKQKYSEKTLLQYRFQI